MKSERALNVIIESLPLGRGKFDRDTQSLLVQLTEGEEPLSITAEECIMLSEAFKSAALHLYAE